MNITPGGDSMSTPLLKNIAEQVNSDKINDRLQRTRDRIYGDWLLEAQPFRVVGRELSEQDIATHLEGSKGSYWKEHWLGFFDSETMQDPEIQLNVDRVKRCSLL